MLVAREAIAIFGIRVGFILHPMTSITLTPFFLTHARPVGFNSAASCHYSRTGTNAALGSIPR